MRILNNIIQINNITFPLKDLILFDYVADYYITLDYRSIHPRQFLPMWKYIPLYTWINNDNNN